MKNIFDEKEIDNLRDSYYEIIKEKFIEHIIKWINLNKDNEIILQQGINEIYEIIHNDGFSSGESCGANNSVW